MKPLRLRGRVVRGDGLGRKLGFPTANLAVPPSRHPPRGVYRVLVSGGPFKLPRPGACSVGVRPTLGGGLAPRLEVHIPGFRGDLYGRRLALAFVERLRPERKFASLSALKAQIRRDLKRVRGAPGQRAPR